MNKFYFGGTIIMIKKYLKLINDERKSQSITVAKAAGCAWYTDGDFPCSSYDAGTCDAVAALDTCGNSSSDYSTCNNFAAVDGQFGCTAYD